MLPIMDNNVIKKLKPFFPHSCMHAYTKQYWTTENQVKNLYELLETWSTFKFYLDENFHQKYSSSMLDLKQDTIREYVSCLHWNRMPLLEKMEEGNELIIIWLRTITHYEKICVWNQERNVTISSKLVKNPTLLQQTRRKRKSYREFIPH